MPGLVLYDNPMSSNALKVRFLLAELGLAYERRTVALSPAAPGRVTSRSTRSAASPCSTTTGSC